MSERSIDDLLDELRIAGPHPDEELSDAIRAYCAGAVSPLVAMVSNPVEYEIAEGDDENRTGWAPYFVIEILGELRPPEALEPLVTLLTWDDYDFLSGPLTEALGKFGQAALDPVTAILRDRGQSAWARWRAATAMRLIAESVPELRAEVVGRLTAQLDADEPDYEDLDVFKGALVSELLSLRAHESIPSIVRAFEQDLIDPYQVSWLDVREELDVPPDVAPHLDQEAARRQSLFDSPFGSHFAQPSSELASTWHPADRRAATLPYRRETPKVGRNDPCPCGSGKKYKRCHGQ